MKLLTERQLEELTGKHRKTIKEALQGVPFKPGPNRAHLYQSTVALPVLYAAVRSLEEARIKQAETQAHLNQIRAEIIRKERIPRQDVLDLEDEVQQATAAILKAAEGKILTQAIINDIFDKLRSIPEKIEIL